MVKEVFKAGRGRTIQSVNLMSVEDIINRLAKVAINPAITNKRSLYKLWDITQKIKNAGADYFFCKIILALAQNYKCPEELLIQIMLDKYSYETWTMAIVSKAMETLEFKQLIHRYRRNEHIKA
ncbi:hypothetical protein [Neomoorella thermoacetica]|nr:hypothetical protein [Moorella thermoacetica]